MYAVVFGVIFFIVSVGLLVLYIIPRRKLRSREKMAESFSGKEYNFMLEQFFLEIRDYVDEIQDEWTHVPNDSWTVTLLSVFQAANEQLFLKVFHDLNSYLKCKGYEARMGKDDLIEVRSILTIARTVDLLNSAEMSIEKLLGSNWPLFIVRGINVSCEIRGGTIYVLIHGLDVPGLFRETCLTIGGVRMMKNAELPGFWRYITMEKGKNGWMISEVPWKEVFVFSLRKNDSQ